MGSGHWFRCARAMGPGWAVIAGPMGRKLDQPEVVRNAEEGRRQGPSEMYITQLTLGCSLMGTNTRTDTLMGFSLVMSAKVLFSSRDNRPVLCTRSNSANKKQKAHNEHLRTVNN